MVRAPGGRTVRTAYRVAPQALPNTTVVTFDTFGRPYQRAALRYIRHDLGLSSRLHVGIGDTLRTVRHFAEAHRHMRCDLTHPLHGRDMAALQVMSRIPRALVIMPKFRPTRSWEDALRDGLIWNSTCAALTVGGSDYKFIEGEKQHVFCNSPPFEI